jgi:hypothetical protein
MTPTKWKIEQSAQTRAGMQADALVRRLGLSYPIDLFRIAKEEFPRLRIGGSDFGNRFDGKLRYNSEKRCFALLYNTKYDAGCRPGNHHPRTRFSIAHELGHYYLEHHHAYLTHGGRSHASINEFRSKSLIEKEADAFAASLLLPTDFVNPIVNSGEVSLARLEDLATNFETSLVSTAIRSVQLSHFPCALVGIRQSAVAWTFPSSALIRAGIYPNKGVLPRNVSEPRAGFHVGAGDQPKTEGRVRDWFNTYERDDLGQVFVTEEYVPVTSMGTLLVLITMDENDVSSDEEEENEGD